MGMNKDETDYSLSYDEYLENFRKTHHPRAIAMSKDQYELMQAREEAQKKREAAREAGTAEGAWAYQKGPSDEIVEKITGKVDPSHEEVMDAANEIIERKITPDQQGIQSKGNPDENKVANQDNPYDTRSIGDKALDYMLQKGLISKKFYDKITNQENIDDTRAIGATKEELDYMLQNGLISKAAYDKQIAALNTPEVQEAMEAGAKKADETVWDPTDRDASDDGSDDDGGSDDGGDDDDEPEDNYKKSMMSIWDAYRAGLIDKETAGYFTIDAIATLAKNLGRSIGNVGAQFSGGTIDNGHDESKWGQRQKAVMEEEIQKELEGLGSKASRQAESEKLDNEAKKIRNAYTPKQLEQQIEMFKKELEMAGINISKAKNTQDIIDYIKEDPNYVNSPFKMAMVAYLSQTGVGGAAKSGADALNWLLTVFK